MEPLSKSLFKSNQSYDADPSSAAVGVWQRCLPSFLPVGLLGGFLLVVWLLFGDRLLPAKPVEVVTVVTIESTPEQGNLKAAESWIKNSTPTVDPFEGQMLFQASGWIEADPFPVRATALTDGVIEEVRVLEGERVEKGAVLATLIAEDNELALAAAEAEVAAKQSEVDGARARLEAARADVKAITSRVRAAESLLEVLEDEADRLEQAGSEAVQARQIRQASLRVQAQRAEIASLKANRTEAEASLNAFESDVERAKRDLQFAKVRRDEAQLALDRTLIRSPINGVVQTLHAAPGKKKMLRMDGIDSATIAILFDPESLQARIDVPLDQAAQLSLGQPVRLRTNLLPEARLRGRVTRIVGEADIQRNTLQAKVALLDPHPRLRPEMLCRAEFLPPAPNEGKGADVVAQARGKGAPGSGIQVFVPEAAISPLGGEEALVWTVPPGSDRLAQREIVLGAASREGHREVLAGLKPGQVVVLDPNPDFREGQRVRPRRR